MVSGLYRPAGFWLRSLRAATAQGYSGNGPPAFTSPATASVAENNFGTVYTATASAANGDTVPFSISAAADAALFQMTPAAALSFRARADCDAPFDANRDNVVTAG